MKIGIYDPYLDDLGGGEKYMMTIAECLSDAHDVTIFWNNKEDVAIVKERFGLDLSKIALSKNIFTPGFSFLKRLQVTHQYDIIIVLSDGSIPLSFSKKLLIHVQQPLAQFESRSWKDKWKLSRVDTFFCNSEFTRRFVKKELQSKSIILYPPVSLHPQKITKENIILHVGRFRVKNVSVDDYKKQGLMVRVFKEMIDDGLKHWQFVVATSVLAKDSEAFEKLKAQANGYPIEFVVNCNNRKLWDVYNKAKIYWHASGFGEDLQKHPEFAEHFGISTVEAMGAGAVPVVINAGGQTEIVEENKNGLLWETIDALKKKTLLLTKDEKLREKLSENAKARAKDFGLERFCQEVQALIA